jgi:hypothetical protein
MNLGLPGAVMVIRASIARFRNREIETHTGRNLARE